MDRELLSCIEDLNDVAGLLKSDFVAKDDLIETLMLCVISQEHLLIVGPPGTAKSEIAKRFSLLCSPRASSGGNGKIPYFEYLFTRFTEPSEIFGPVDINTFREGGGHLRTTDGMLPRAEIAFLDEVFKANSAILNALLTLLNERLFYNGGTPIPVPLITCIGAANEIPDDPNLGALFDRFLLRMWSDNVEDNRFDELFRRGWKLETDRIKAGYLMKLVAMTSTDKIRRIYRAIDEVKLEPVAREYREVVRRIRAEGIAMSDRRVIKLLKLVAASALRNKRLEANTGDFWVLKHIWNNPDQIPHLQIIIDPYLTDFHDIHWSPERKLEVISADIDLLAANHERLRTDADFADFLQSAERLRRELLGHSDEEGRKPLVNRLEKMIENVLRLLEG